MTHRLTVTRGMNVAEDAGCSFPAAADRIAVSGGNIRIEALGKHNSAQTLDVRS